MKAPPFFRIVISGSVDAVQKRLDRSGLQYLLDRLVSGETVAEEEFAHYGVFVEVEDHHHRWIDVTHMQDRYPQQRCVICGEEREVRRFTYHYMRYGLSGDHEWGSVDDAVGVAASDQEYGEAMPVKITDEEGNVVLEGRELEAAIDECIRSWEEARKPESQKTGI